MSNEELQQQARDYVQSPQFAIDMRQIRERAEELSKHIKAMEKIAAALWREPMTI